MIEDSWFLWFKKRWKEIQALFAGVDCSHIRITCTKEGRKK